MTRPAPALVMLLVGLIFAPLPADVVLLHNGNTLTGQVRPDGDRWAIDLSEGGSVSVDRQTVAFIAADYDTVYRHLRRQLTAGSNPLAWNRLINWSLRHGLDRCAAADLEELERWSDEPQRWAYLRRRVEAARREAAQEAAQGPESAGTDSKLNAAGSGLGPQSGPGLSDRTVVGRAPRGGVTAESDIGQGSRLMTAARLQEFSREVFPILTNRCSGAGCHSDRGSNVQRPFRFIDLASSAEITRRNAHATLRWIISDHPDESPLLTKAGTAHGSMTQVPIERREAVLWDRLRGWVSSIVRDSSDGTQGMRQAVAEAPLDDKSDPLDPSRFNLQTPQPTAGGVDEGGPADESGSERPRFDSLVE